MGVEINSIRKFWTLSTALYILLLFILFKYKVKIIINFTVDNSTAKSKKQTLSTISKQPTPSSKEGVLKDEMKDESSKMRDRHTPSSFH